MRTPKQIENSRAVLVGIVGPYALLCSDEQIDGIMDLIQRKANEEFTPVEDDVFLIEFKKEIAPAIYSRITNLGIHTAREFMSTDKSELLNIMTERYYEYLMKIFIEEFTD